MTIVLTNPLSSDDLKWAMPRETAGMAHGELDAKLEMLEYALRATFGITGKDSATNAVLRQAMRLGWPSFLAQVRQVAQETAGATSASRTYARAGVLDFVWPAMVTHVLAPVADEEAAAAEPPTTTRLVR